ALRYDGGHPEPMPHVAVDRYADPEDEHGRGGDRPGRPPEHGPPGRRQELLAGPQLVRERDPDSEVRVEVQEMPRLVPDPATSRPDARQHTQAQTDRAADREQHARVVDRQV